MCDNCIFGWILIGNENCPIAHHVGIILQWNKYDTSSSIVAHYGPNGIPKVFVETLYDAVMRSKPKTIYINTNIKASFKHTPYFIGPKIIKGIELLEYESKHPVYDVITSNCQHFVQYFTGISYIESDIHKELRSIFSTLIPLAIFGDSSAISLYFKDMIKTHINIGASGICAWDDDCIDIDYSEI